MGHAARMKRKQHENRQQAQQRMRDLVPGLEARVEALGREFDDECATLVSNYAVAQRPALAVAGYRLRVPNADGLGMWDAGNRRLLHSVAREDDGQVWAHVSVSHRDDTMPDWYEVQRAGRLLYPSLYGIIVVAPETMHVNIANVAHAWYCLTMQVLPDFTGGTGSI